MSLACIWCMKQDGRRSRPHFADRFWSMMATSGRHGGVPRYQDGMGPFGKISRWYDGPPFRYTNLEEQTAHAAAVLNRIAGCSRRRPEKFTQKEGNPKFPSNGGLLLDLGEGRNMPIRPLLGVVPQTAHSPGILARLCGFLGVLVVRNGVSPAN